MAVVTGLMVAAPMLGWHRIREKVPGGAVWCVLVILIGLVFLHPWVFTHVANVVLKRLGRQPLRTRIPFRDYVLPLLTTFGQWVFIGLALWCMTRSVTGPSLTLSRAPLFMAIAALAMTVSYLAFFSPGGVGVREEIFLLALAPLAHVGNEKATLIAVAIRILQTLVEIILTGIGLLVLRSLKTTAPAAGEGSGDSGCTAPTGTAQQI